MKLKTSVFLLTFFIIVTITEKAKIRKLTEANLQQFSKDNSYWLVQISQGRCVQCVSQEKELQQLAFVLDGAVKVGKIDAKLIPNLKIEKSPTYIFTRSDRPQNSIPFKGKFSLKDITRFCLEGLGSNFKDREGKYQPSSKEDSTGGRSKSSQGSSSSQSSSSTSSVIELTDQVFQSKVLKSNDAWLVQFYSPGCGHCRNFEPQYAKLPKLIGKRVHIARIDGTKNQQFMGKYQVKGFPTVLLFDTENKNEPIPYNGQRTAQDVVEWLKGQNINEEKKQILELNKHNYIHECNRNIICLIFILDNKTDRQKLTWLQDTLLEQTEKPFRFFFSQRLNQFQSQLMINDRAAPVLVSVWDSINSYRIYNGALTHDDLNSYLKTILERRGWIKSQGKIVDSIFAINSSEL